MAHSKETKQKISASMKVVWTKKKSSPNLSTIRKEQLSKAFSYGHPDGIQPNAVRSYGDIERRNIQPKDVVRTVVSSENMPDTKDTSVRDKITEWKNKKLGESGGKIRYSQNITSVDAKTEASTSVKLYNGNTNGK